MNRRKTIGLLYIIAGVSLVDFPVFIKMPNLTPIQKWGSFVVGIALVAYGAYKIYTAKRPQDQDQNTKL